MQEPLELISLNAHLSGNFRIKGINEDPFGSFKSSTIFNLFLVQESTRNDPENLWKSYHLFTDYLKFVIKSGNYPPEMLHDFKKISNMNYFNYLSFPVNIF